MSIKYFHSDEPDPEADEAEDEAITAVNIHIRPDGNEGFRWTLDVDGERIGEGNSGMEHVAILDAREAFKKLRRPGWIPKADPA